MKERLAFRLGAIGGLLGTDGGANGSGFGGPSVNPADPTGMANLGTTFNQLQGIANGTGPNPAMAQYNQNVQNLAKQQAGAIGSVQGISPALAARMATQQGSAAMQNAAAQGATTQSQQQLGALGQMGNVANAQAGNATSMQQNVNNVNSTLAGTNMQGQQGLIGGAMSGFGLMSSAGGAAASGGVAGGGIITKHGAVNGAPVQRYADGGSVGPQSQFAQFLTSSMAPTSAPAVQMAASANSGSSIAGGLGGTGGAAGKKAPPQKNSAAPATENAGQGPTTANASSMDSDIPYAQPTYSTNFAKGGAVPAMVSPGELRIPRNQVAQVAAGKNPMAAGERIPGKPKVAGNSYSNDVVPKTLQEGDVIIPNSIMQSKNPAKGAQDFIAKIVAKRGKK